MAEETKAPEAKKPQAPRQWDKVAIEIAEDNNRQFHFPPLAETLRGRWNNTNLGLNAAPTEALMGMPTIPGVQVHLDIRSGRWGLHDPLSDDDNKGVLERCASAHHAMNGIRLSPRPDIDRRAANDSEVATVLYWMMRAVQLRCAVVTSGSLPRSKEEIEAAFPGARIRQDYSDLHARGEQ